MNISKLLSCNQEVMSSSFEPLVEMQGKVVYNRSLWLAPSPDPMHSVSFNASNLPLMCILILNYFLIYREISIDIF